MGFLSLLLAGVLYMFFMSQLFTCFSSLVESSNEQEAPPQPHPLSYEDPEEKAVIPSESDVLDILSSAHALQSQVKSWKPSA